MKLLLISDTHCGARNNHKIINEYIIKFFDDILFPYIESNNIDAIVHMGDIFDSRKSIDISILNQWNKVVFKRLNDYDIPVYITIGNHDCYYTKQNYPNSVIELLSDYDNFNIIYDKPIEIELGKKCLFVPWSYEGNNFDDIIYNSCAQLCFGHFEIKGFQVLKGFVNVDKGFSTDVFKKFDKVFSGHYHIASNNGNITYIGTPYQLTWNDCDNDKGFYILDTDNLNLEYIKNPYTLFERFEYDDDCDIAIPNLNNKFVKVIVNNNDNKVKYNKFISQLESYNTIETNISFKTKIDNNVNLNFENIKDTKDLINDYIDNNIGGLNTINDNIIGLKKYIFDLYNNANNMEY